MLSVFVDYLGLQGRRKWEFRSLSGRAVTQKRHR